MSLVLMLTFKKHSHCPGGEIGRRTGLKILDFGQTGVPVQFRPGAPTTSKLLKSRETHRSRLEPKILNKNTDLMLKPGAELNLTCFLIGLFVQVNCLFQI
jgi:hypothetical protein